MGKIWWNDGDFQLWLRAKVQENQGMLRPAVGVVRETSPLDLHQLETLRGAKYRGRTAPR